MAYLSKEQDHEKRRNGEGSYSPYNWIYHYLLDNFETSQNIPMDILQKEYKAYCYKCNVPYSDGKARQDITEAISNFKSNDGKRGDTANNLGKKQTNSFETIKSSISDLKW